MKKVVFMLLVVLFAGCPSCMAQDNNQRQGFGGPRGQRMDPKERIENMIKYLELDETRAAQFKVVMEEQQKQIAEQLQENSAILNGERPSEEQIKEFREKMQEKQAAINTVLQLILTEEQFEKYQKMTERRGYMGGRGNRPNRERQNEQ